MIEKLVPATSIQAGVWLLDQVTGGAPIHNLSYAYELRGRLDTDAMREAFATVAKRHEILQTVFEFRDDGELLQHVSSQTVAELERQTLHATENLGKVLSNYARTRFYLSRGPLFRARLISSPSDNHILVFVFHHAVFDGLSMGVFLDELSAAYNGTVKKQALILGQGIAQYALQANAERASIRHNIGKHLEFWRRELHSVMPLNLPTDLPRPAAQSFRGRREYFALDIELIEAARRLASELKITPFTVFLAGFFGLLYRYVQQEDLILGFPIAMRTKKGTRQAIGPYVNLLPIRVRVADNVAFSELLMHVKRDLAGAYLNCQIPFGKLVEELGIRRDRSRNPLVDVLFQYSPRYLPSFNNVGASELEIDAGSSEFDLSLSLFEDKAQVSGYFEYSTDLFHEDSIKRMVAHYLNFLRAAVHSPADSVQTQPYLTVEESDRLIRLFNQTDQPFPEKRCVHGLFEEQVERVPHRAAVGFEGRHLTYVELDAKANLLAARLRSAGVGPGCFVGVLLPVSLDIVVALLAVLKSGASYLPLDPSFPHSRLDFMLQDSGAAALVISESTTNLLSPFNGKVITVDGLHDVESEGTLVEANVNSDSLCYLIYTSGSTGIPKGVQITHRSVVNFLTSMKSRPGIKETDVLLSVTTISFDIFVLEMFLPLISGAKVVLVSKEVAGNGLKLGEVLKSSGATIMQGTPTTWQLLVDTGWKGCLNLKVLCGGEVVSKSLADQLLVRCGSFWNMYGPTETTVWSMTKQITSSDKITLGSPIDNTQVYILDRGGQLVPVGVEGELYIGGEGLSVGYLNRDELTKERFLENPYRPGHRLYRTGDLARRQANGEIEFIGRVDYQVKVRGYRIELGEIEAVMKRHAGVSQAVVLAREDHVGSKRLVGYYGTIAGEDIGPTEMRALLKSNLPGYMVPSNLVFLKSFPTTPNGKIDRKALPAPEQHFVREEATGGVPRDAVERQLTRLWERILGRSPIDIHDNFFEIGGHSILAAHLIATIEKEMGRRLPLATLFEHQTIEGMAEILRKFDQKAAWPSLVEMHSGGMGFPFFLIHGAEGNVLLYRSLSESLGRYRPVFGLQSKGLDGLTTPKTTVEDMASSYIEEIKRIQPNGLFFLGGYCMGGTVALEMARQLCSAGLPVGLVALFETYNVRKGPANPSSMFRSGLYVQNMYFHMSNLLMAGMSYNGMPFFLTKSGTAWRRLISRAALVLRRWPSIGSEAYPHRLITKLNDSAQMKYEPHCYDGNVVLFKPQRWFLGLTAPVFGWLGLLRTLDVVQLPVNPRGMLVSPFVSILAEKLEARLAAIESKAEQSYSSRSVPMVADEE